jgi:hypothetical protein
MADEDLEPTNDADTDCGFVEMPMSIFQVNAVKPLIAASKRNRKGLLLVSCAPDPPNAWRMQIVGLSQRGCEKVRRIIKEELK